MSWLFQGLTGFQPRTRWVYLLLLAGVIATGLFSRSDYAGILPGFFGTYAGDTLWTLAIYLTLAVLFHRATSVLIGGVSALISYAVEFSQLYQADWINALRDTTFGALALGSGFLGSDFICYSVGALMGVGLDRMMLTSKERSLPALRPDASP